MCAYTVGCKRYLSAFCKDALMLKLVSNIRRSKTWLSVLYSEQKSLKSSTNIWRSDEDGLQRECKIPTLQQVILRIPSRATTHLWYRCIFTPLYCIYLQPTLSHESGAVHNFASFLDTGLGFMPTTMQNWKRTQIQKKNDLQQNYNCIF